jgi:hypothetical protein
MCGEDFDPLLGGLMSTSKTLFPFRLKDNLELEVEVPMLKGSEVRLDNTAFLPDADYGTKQLDIASATPQWIALSVPVAFKLGMEDLTSLLATGEKDDAVVGIISVRCSAAKYRHGVELQFDGISTWAGMVELERADIRNIVQLVPQVVRKENAKTSAEGAAEFAGAVIATGPTYDIIVDRDAKPYQGPVKYKWLNFAESTNPWIASRKNDVCYVDLGDVPVIYLNLRWKSLQPILQNEATTGMPAAMRNTYAAAIGQSGWIQLYLAAIGSIVYDEENDSYFAHPGWRLQLAKHVAEKLFPEASTAEAMRKLYEDFKDPERVPTIIAKVGSITHEQTDAGQLLDRAAFSVNLNQGDA